MVIDWRMEAKVFSLDAQKSLSAETHALHADAERLGDLWISHTAKAAQDEDVAIKRRHGLHDLGEKDLIELRRGFRFRRLMLVLVSTTTRVSPAVVAHQIQSDAE